MPLQQISACNNNTANLVQLCFNNRYATIIQLRFTYLQTLVINSLYPLSECKN
jgi:hypothetical protein